MRTKAYLLSWEDTNCLMAVRKIEMAIPCFIVILNKDEDWFEVTITCREEDIAYVERELAPYV